jgi:nitrate reductase NapAB chaperone NapD
LQPLIAASRKDETRTISQVIAELENYEIDTNDPAAIGQLLAFLEKLKDQVVEARI